MKNNLVVALLGVAIGGIGFGLITPVTVIILEKHQIASWIIGTVTTVGYLSIVIFSGVAGRLIDKYNVRRVLLSGLFIWTMGALGHIFWYNIIILTIVKFIMGIGGTLVFVTTEVIINSISDETNRGSNTTIYVVLLSIGIAVGTLLIWTVNIGTWVPFVIGSSIMFIVLLIELLFLTDIQLPPKNKSEKFSLLDMPLLSLLSAIVYGIFESSVIVALPIYGFRNNFSQTEITYFLASFVIGGIVLLYFIGIVSDKYIKYHILLTIFLSLSVLFIIPSILNNFVMLIVVFFVIGGIVPAIYSIGLSYTVEKISNKFMTQANGRFVMMYGVGTLIGPIIGSMMVELEKKIGYWIFSSLLCLIFFVIFYFNDGKNKQQN